MAKIVLFFSSKVVVFVVFVVVFCVAGPVLWFLYGNNNLRHGVISVPSPRVTLENSSRGKVCTFENAVFAEGLKRILGTSRGEPACRGC